MSRSLAAPALAAAVLLSSTGAAEAFAAPSSHPSAAFGAAAASRRNEPPFLAGRDLGFQPRAATTALRASFLMDWFRPSDAAKSVTAKAANEYDEGIESSLEILNRAAVSKDEDPEDVVGALEDLEKLMRAKCKAEPEFASSILGNLDGSWRLVFTTGTKETQDRIGAKVNYFPVKAVQSFDISTDPFGIENGIYVGDFAVVKFRGPFDFDLKKRKVEFDFTSIAILGFEIAIKSSDAAKIGSSTGLGSEGNVANAERGKRPFFNWISADENIATARGGGGGLALWKRVEAAGEATEAAKE